MNICAIEANSFLDYPGKLSCVVFLQGCNYDCFYCHNRALIDNKKGIMGYQEVVDFLKSRQDFLQAMVISGGEPTLNEDLGLLIQQAKEMRYLVKLDTNGSRPKTLSSLLEEGTIEYVALDVKAPWNRYRDIAGKGADPKKVQESLSLLASLKEAREEFHLEVRGLRLLPHSRLEISRTSPQFCRKQQAGQSMSIAHHPCIERRMLGESSSPR